MMQKERDWISTKTRELERLNLESIDTKKPSGHVLLFSIFGFPM
jgi:hypothetical protein